MQARKQLEELVLELSERHGQLTRPVILFLGTKCGEAAGVPGPEVMARPVLEELRRLDPDIAEALLPTEEHDETESVSAFLKFLSSLPSVQRSQVLQPFYGRVPVPLFYQDLATLILAGYFPHVLTTNWDSLLEQALGANGLRREIDYQVVVLSVPPTKGDLSDEAVTTNGAVQIIKLHGDLGQSEIAVTSTEIEAAITSQHRLVAAELQRDVVIVGYEFESKPVDTWLARLPGGKLWWVSPERPQSAQMRHIEQLRDVVYLEGESADPTAFFGLLLTFLLRLPVVKALEAPFEHFLASAGSPKTSPGDDPLTPSSIHETPSDDEVNAEYLRGQLNRLQALKQTLEYALPPGESNTAIDTQLDYQRRQVADLQDQVRSLNLTQETLASFVKRFNQVLERARTVDHDTVSYMTDQLRIVQREAEKSSPNQDVLTASLGALSVMAQRLGPELSGSDLLSELTKYAPTS